MKTFLIEAYGYGGELVLGECNPAFVAHWKPIVQEDGDAELIETLHELDNYEDEPEDALADPDAPPVPFVNGEYKTWFDFDNIEHVSGVFSDSMIRVCEIDPETGEENGNFEAEYEISEFRTIASREAYFTDSDVSPEPDNKNYVPVLSVMSSEKGSFWSTTFEAEEFNPALLGVVVLESTLAEFVDGVYYNFKELELDYDYVSTTGKGMYASVGWMNKEWHDDTVTCIDEALAEWKEEIEIEI